MMRGALVVFVAMLGCAMAQGPGPKPKPVEPAKLPADWAQRDLEGKWVAFRTATGDAAGDPRQKEAWAKALAASGDPELLEWIAIYEGWRVAGPQLARLDAPQLLRAAAWNLGSLDSHNLDNAEKAMRDRGAVAVGWFRVHPIAQRGKGALIYAELAAQHEPRDAAMFLPPHDPMQVLVPWLDAPADVAEFGVRLTAKPRVRYVHQVLRALDGVAVYGRPDASIVRKVLRLCRHQRQAIRSAAFTTLSKLPGDLVPFAGLIGIVQDDELPADWRALAMLALAPSSHPQAFFELHAIAANVGHPGRTVAITMLGEIGDDTTLAALTNPAGTVGLEVAMSLQQAAARIAERKQQRDFLQVGKLRTMLWRIAWLRANDDPRAAAHGQAAMTLLKALDPAGGPQGILQRALAAARVVAETPFGPGEAERIDREMRKFADELRGR